MSPSAILGIPLPVLIRPQNAGPGERLYSVFRCENPADQVPLIACIITMIDLCCILRKLTISLRKAKLTMWTDDTPGSVPCGRRAFWRAVGCG